MLRLRPDGAPSDRVRQIEIRTRGAGVVSVASIAIYNKQSGVSYNNIGYPGATVDLLNKFDETLMADDLRRLNPQIVVLVFGTNEASKPNLDAARYEQNYEKAIARIRAALPKPKSCWSDRPTAPSGRRIAPAKARPTPPAIRRRRATPVGHGAGGLRLAHPPEARYGPRRRAQDRRAPRFRLLELGVDQSEPVRLAQLVDASPPLMTPDHVHFTLPATTRAPSSSSTR